MIFYIFFLCWKKKKIVIMKVFVHHTQIKHRNIIHFGFVLGVMKGYGTNWCAYFCFLFFFIFLNIMIVFDRIDMTLPALELLKNRIPFGPNFQNSRSSATYAEDQWKYYRDLNSNALQRLSPLITETKIAKYCCTWYCLLFICKTTFLVFFFLTVFQK